MGKLIFFVGPGGAGKTTISKGISKKFHFKYFHSDTHSINKAKKTILDLKKLASDKVYLLDIGAEFQYYTPLDFFSRYGNKIICVYNTPDICYERYNNRPTLKPRKSFESFKDKEFCSERRRLYDFADYKIVTNANVERCISRATNFINEILLNNNETLI